MSGTEKLGSFLREVSNWQWDAFVKAEHDKSYTSNQAMIFALVRSCAMQKMDAIRMSLNRLDGKLKTPLKVEYPKIYYLFPNAKSVMSDEIEVDGKKMITTKPPGPNVVEGKLVVQAPPEEDDLPSMTLRETLTKMSGLPRELPEAIVQLAQQTEQWLQDHAPKPDEIPMVKSVVAAHLLILAQKRDIGALSEVFDQIDGKLAETLQIIGEDIYITSYSEIAPPGAELNKDGVLQAEATIAQDLWAHKLGKEILNNG